MQTEHIGKIKAGWVKPDRGITLIRLKDEASGMRGAGKAYDNE